MTIAPALGALQVGFADQEDEVLAAEDALIVEGECVSCTCTQDHGCDPPCSWNENYLVPLCSSCAPPATIVVDDLDVEDLVIDALGTAGAEGLTHGMIERLVGLRFLQRDVPASAIELAVALLVDDELVEVLDGERAGEDVFRLVSRGRRSRNGK